MVMYAWHEIRVFYKLSTLFIFTDNYSMGMTPSMKQQISMSKFCFYPFLPGLPYNGGSIYARILWIFEVWIQSIHLLLFSPYGTLGIWQSRIQLYQLVYILDLLDILLILYASECIWFSFVLQWYFATSKCLPIHSRRWSRLLFETMAFVSSVWHYIISTTIYMIFISFGNTNAWHLPITTYSYFQAVQCFMTCLWHGHVLCMRSQRACMQALQYTRCFFHKSFGNYKYMLRISMSLFKWWYDHDNYIHTFSLTISH